MGKASGLFGKVPGVRQAANLRRLKRQGLNMDPAMLSSLGDLAGGGGAGLDMAGLGLEGPRRKTGDPGKKKAARKKQRKARRKNRRK